MLPTPRTRPSVFGEVGYISPVQRVWKVGIRLCFNITMWFKHSYARVAGTLCQQNIKTQVKPRSLQFLCEYWQLAKKQKEDRLSTDGCYLNINQACTNSGGINEIGAVTQKVGLG
jgi:hypothetical protein